MITDRKKEKEKKRGRIDANGNTLRVLFVLPSSSDLLSETCVCDGLWTSVWREVTHPVRLSGR